MNYKMLFANENEESMEKYELAKERISQIPHEETVPLLYRDFFTDTANYILKLLDITKLNSDDSFANLGIEELKRLNHLVYEDLLIENYSKSYSNPEYMGSKYGEVYGKYLCYLYMNIIKMIPYAHLYRIKELTIYMELYILMYNIFENEEILSEKELYDTVYWFESDYTDVFMENAIREQLDTDMDYYTDIVCNANLSSENYLYRYGKYITDNEINTAKFLSSMSEEEIDDIARTYTEGYKRGFILGRKDLSIKKIVEIRYQVGFERVVKAAIKQFEAMGLTTVIRGMMITSTSPNKQADFDHKFDFGIYYDKAIVDRKLSVAKVAFEKYKDNASVFAGPAVIEVFGETPFEPANTKGTIKLDEKQRKLYGMYRNSYLQIYHEYIKGDETSFTIIAYPIPEIGDNYKEIFMDTIKINNLDAALYTKIQQCIIDALDTAKYVEVKGKDGNKTDMKVFLHELKDSSKETLFENCVADVNIPAGEVFTSPRLKGTSGILNVSEVFLNDLKFTNLSITFEDGMIKEYDCDNFINKEDGKKLGKDYIRENLLQNRETLPIGEFAIGTNTTAYVIAKKYDIVYKLPILIVEKMGPHFAVGDTCYSFEEDAVTYNPDGKSIVARENEISALRHTDMEKAYFGIHTDITIPYDEIGEISAVDNDGNKITIISNGRFVLDGTKELNIPFENC